MKYEKRYEKQQLIKEWTQKGLEWCTESLWKARRDNNDIIEKDRELRKRIKEQQKEISAFSENKERLDNALSLIRSGNIPTMLLRIKYTVKPCQDGRYYLCSRYAEDAEYDLCDEYGSCVLEETHIKIFSLLTYEISLNEDDYWLDGIDNELRIVHFNVKKVVNERTGDVVFDIKDAK